MESAALVLTAAIVVVLQIITIALVLSLKKKGKVVSNTRADASRNNQRNDNRGNNNSRRNSNRPQDNRSRGRQPRQSTAQAADPMEKSLRDINLKLKNAERDQESTRRKMQGKNSRDDRSANPKNRRDDNRFSKKGGGNRPNKPNRQKEDENNPADEVKKNGVSEPVTETKPVNNTAPQPSNPSVSATDSGSNEGNLQHGRKFAVKRRALSGEEQGGSAEKKDSDVKESMDTQETEIRFGRR